MRRGVAARGIFKLGLLPAAEKGGVTTVKNEKPKLYHKSRC